MKKKKRGEGRREGGRERGKEGRGRGNLKIPFVKKKGGAQKGKEKPEFIPNLNGMNACAISQGAGAGAGVVIIHNLI